MKNTQDVGSLFFTQAQMGAAYVEYGEYIAKTPGIQFHVPSLDAYVIPPRPGQMVVAVARPGQGKTSFAVAFAKKTVDDIIRRNAKESELVIYITWDQPMEEIAMMYYAEQGISVEDYAWGRLSKAQLVAQASKHVGDPFWAVGVSVTQTNQADLTFENVFASISQIKSQFGRKPVLVIIDYIQRIYIPRRTERPAMVAEASMQAANLAKDLACPMIVLAQAGRQVDKSDTRIPDLADCQHSSQLEQDATKVYGLMRPAVAMYGQTELDVVDSSGHKQKIPITENLMLLKVAKQRMTKAGKIFPLYLNPATLRMEDLYFEERNKAEGNG